MQKNKAIQILRTFTPAEFKDFGKFIASPYFNAPKSVIRLFNYIEKYFPLFENKALDIRRVISKLNLEGSNPEGTLRNTLTDLNLLIRKFLSLEHYANLEYKMKYAEVFQLYNRKLENLYEKELENYFSKFGEMNQRTEEYQYETLELLNLRIMNAFSKGDAKIDTEAFVKQSEFASMITLDYLLGCKRLTNLNKYSHNFDYVSLSSAMFDALDFEKYLSYVKIHSPNIYQIVSLEYYVLKMTLNLDFEESNEKLKILFAQNADFNKIDHSPVWYYFTIAWMNAFLYRINLHSTSHEDIYSKSQELIPMIILRLEKKLYKAISQWLPLANFTNYTDYAFLAGETEWIKNFILEYSGELKSNEKDDAVNYAWGVYYYSIGEYVESLSSFLKVQETFPTLFVNVKRFMMLCHYQLGNLETAISNCESTLRLLERKIKGNNVAEWQIEEIKFFRKFFKIAGNTSHDGLDEFDFELSKTKPRVSYFVAKFVKKLKSA